MSDKQKMVCPNCMKSLQFPTNQAGNRAKCPACNSALLLGVTGSNPNKPVIKSSPHVEAQSQPQVAAPQTIVQTVHVNTPSNSANSLGIASMVLGIISFLVCWIPLVGVGFAGLGSLLGIAALVISVTRKGTGIGYAIAGTAISATGVLLGVIFVVMIAGAIDGVNQIDAALGASSESGNSDADQKNIRRARIAVDNPIGVGYRCEEGENITGKKRTVDVWLDCRVTEEMLEKLAHKIRSSDNRKYERTFIGYYLPGAGPNSGYWATTHFNPDLEVRINGMMVSQNEFLHEPRESDDNDNIIGIWINEDFPYPSRVKIYRLGEKVFLNCTYADGSSGDHQFTEHASGVRFDLLPDRGHGEHYKIDRKGNLTMCDAEGVPFGTYKMVKLSSATLRAVNRPGGL